MIVCMKCGFHNNDGAEFCVKCGTFLEWDGEMVAAAAPEPVVAETPVVAEPPRAGVLRRIKRSLGIGEHGEGAN